MDVIRHYMSVNRSVTSTQIVSAMLHDILEDDERILDLYASKAYGFDAYFEHRFGYYVNKVATTLKTKPLEIKRYVREAEDFYLAYTMLDPAMPDFYAYIREAYEHLRKIEKTPDLITR